jgi:hypothetical protein
MTVVGAPALPSSRKFVYFPSLTFCQRIAKSWEALLFPSPRFAELRGAILFLWPCVLPMPGVPSTIFCQCFVQCYQKRGNILLERWSETCFPRFQFGPRKWKRPAQLGKTGFAFFTFFTFFTFSYFFCFFCFFEGSEL